MCEPSALGKNYGDPIELVTTHREGSVRQIIMGYETQLPRNRSLFAIVGMALAIAAVPYGLGGPLISSIYGGGQLSLFLGLILVLIFDGCVAISLAELASRYPTSSGLYYWTHQMVEAQSWKRPLSFLTGWCWLIGNWSIVLSVNYGFASLLSATVAIYHRNWTANSWQLLLIFYAICILTLSICSLGNRLLPYIDMVAAVWNLVTIVVILVALLSTAKEGRHSAATGFGYYDPSLSGWGPGFTFFIGLLPPAYAFSAIGMITSMAEECYLPELELPRAITLTIPFGGVAALALVLPINFTLPPLQDIIEAPYGQALPFILTRVMGSKLGAVIVMVMVLFIVLFCSISITTAASRCTWAFSRDQAIPLSQLWRRTPFDQPLYALILVTVIEMLLGIIGVGSTSAFTAFASVGVIALSLSYMIPIAISLLRGRKDVSEAQWNLGNRFGAMVNAIAICWIGFKVVLFSMPQTLPVTEASMNYASVVLIGLLVIALIWYIMSGRKVYTGPLEARSE